MVHHWPLPCVNTAVQQHVSEDILAHKLRAFVLSSQQSSAVGRTQRFRHSILLLPEVLRGYVLCSAGPCLGVIVGWCLV